MNNQEKIIMAINTKKRISFLYNKMERIGNPYILGTIKNKCYLFLFQTDGSSSKNDLPNWRLCEFSQINNVEILDQTFEIDDKGFDKKFDKISYIVKKN